ncbi:MAG: hypothetical protein H7245_00265 [Candidatus Saccharibacteria bacterium]|nr:hypothetical protein [Pseudorhodobacter sp.]
MTYLRLLRSTATGLALLTAASVAQAGEMVAAALCRQLFGSNDLVKDRCGAVDDVGVGNALTDHQNTCAIRKDPCPFLHQGQTIGRITRRRIHRAAVIDRDVAL